MGGNAPVIIGAVEGPSRMVAGPALLLALVCLTITVSVAIWGASTPKQFSAVAADEIANYRSDRFLAEPDLWRVHLRSIKALEEATRDAQEDGNAAATAISISLRAFLGGLGFSLISLATLVLELI